MPTNHEDLTQKKITLQKREQVTLKNVYNGYRCTYNIYDG